MAQTKPLLPSWRYLRRIIYLLLFCIPLLVVPWVLIRVLAARPLYAPSYLKQAGGFSLSKIQSMRSWIVAVRVLNAIGGVVAIPILSTLLAQAAAVYTQRRKAEQSLGIRQTFALADRGWFDVQILWGCTCLGRSRDWQRFPSACGYFDHNRLVSLQLSSTPSNAFTGTITPLPSRTTGTSCILASQSLLV